ncbi:hypothetical protein GCM10025865_13190 [Paraoerskovia sediminicola]|uniref:Uncharacterized protein n=1 Tax=Paraoerskovia sediminicola TaxID=1138587 RepID=A0ABN6XBD6_9CELL|nr:hypothetical protein [Paraoerskovia sediminicola]BDZ42020.1 hypothetical protein GCM10025865_13190 [Paraoerskovia sediminicola]
MTLVTAALTSALCLTAFTLARSRTYGPEGRNATNRLNQLAEAMLFLALAAATLVGENGEVFAWPFAGLIFGGIAGMIVSFRGVLRAGQQAPDLTP